MEFIASKKGLILLLVLLVLFRLPHLNRPLSKHHEFNTAVILINAESWEQAGGGAVFNYTPLMNYQGPANRKLEQGPHIDDKGNHVYLSFGAGWYLLPYALFKLLQIPPSPVGLEIISIIIGLITTSLLYYLLQKVTNKNQLAFIGTALFVVLPAPLWYMGTAYVTTAIMLPFVLGIVLLWHRFESNPQSVRYIHILLLVLLGITLCYFDWFAVFLIGMLGIWALLNLRKDKVYIAIAIASFMSIGLGVLLVLWQFASYLGWEQVLHYWRARFTERSTDTTAFSFTQMVWMVAQNLVTGYLPLLFSLGLLIISFFKKKAKATFQWPVWALFSTLPYNILFFNWSAQHEFAWMAFALLASVAVAFYLQPLLQSRNANRYLLCYTIICLALFYIINLPGKKSIKGDEYNSQEMLGNWISNHVDSGTVLFANLPNDKIVEYYSKRTINVASSPQEAARIAIEYDLKRAVYVQVENGRVEKMTILFPPR